MSGHNSKSSLMCNLMIFCLANLIRALIYTVVCLKASSSFRHLASNLKGFECLHDVVHFVGLRVPNLRMFVNVDDDHTV